MFNQQRTAAPGTHPRDHNRAPGTLLDIEGLCHRLEELGLDWADKRAAAEALDEATKSVLGAAVLRIRDKMTVDERQAHARNDEAFQRHLGAVEKAKRAAYQAHVKYEVGKIRVELARSNASTERALATLR